MQATSTSAPVRMHMHRRRRGALQALLLVAIACGSPRHQPDSGGGGPEPQPGLTPVPADRGAPEGSPTSKTISTHGGTLSSADGSVSVSIPAGAVVAPTEFTITPIGNTARGAVGGAFRLGPEGTTFAVPITLTFKGLAVYPFGSTIADIGIEYQDARGFWQRVEPATRDAAANTLSVTTDHFSDWTTTWQSGLPVAEGPIRIIQGVGIPFDAQGRATVYLQSDSPTFTSYVLAGTLTVPDTIVDGGDVCVPAPVTSAWANIAEIDKAKGVFRWGTGASWPLSCTASGGAASTQTMPASFDTMGINLSQCGGAYDPGQIAQLDFLQGAYTTDCGSRGTVRGTWRLSGYQILVDPLSGLVTTEAGGTATFQITLNKPPTADVVVPLSSSDPTEGSVPASVTFTPANWSTPQVVTVTGVNDFVDDGDIQYTIVTGAATSADPHYAGIDPDDVTATNLDDDTAGLVATPSTGLVTTEAGGTATFQLTLASEPLADVVVALSSSNTAEGTVTPASVTFTAATWNVPQTVTLTGVNDFVDDGDIAYSVTATSSSADPLYVGRTATVTATNLDDDTAGLVATPSTGLLTTEAGGTATYQLTLGSQPLADVVVTLASSDTTEGTVAPATVTFTAANWNVPQVVTVTGVNDFVDDGDVAYTVQMSTTSADAKYVGLTGSVSVTNIDDDTAGLVATPSTGLVTTEAGGTATFQLTLGSQPLSDVGVALSSSDTTEGTVSPASVTFTPANWNVAQTVTVTGVDDLVVDGDVAYTVLMSATSADPSYVGVTGAVSVTNTDNDVAGITVGTPSATVTSEAGTTATFTVVLTSQPTADVTVPISSSDTTEGTVSPASVTFTAANWNVPQTVTVTGVDDLVADGTQPYTIVIGPATSADPTYNGKDPADLAFTNTDNDAVGITVGTPSSTSTSESGTSATFTLVLNSQPTGDVTIPLSSTDTTEGIVSPASVTFTIANWNVPQTVTVTGVDDLVADGPQTYQIVIGPASSGDTAYNGLTPARLTFTNTDNDAAGIAVSPPSTSITSEDGTSATFTIVLTSQPTADVTIPLSSNDTTEGTVSPASVVFTAANWNVAQTVTVTGVDDLVADGPQPYTIAIGPASSADLAYNGLDPADLLFTNTDNDTAAITVGTPSATSTSEAGTTATFTLVLTSQPTADVTVPLSSSRPTEGTVSPASVVFTSANWNLPQTVTVTGVDDAVVDGTQTYTIVIGPATSPDPAYNGSDPLDLTFANTDNDVGGITVGTPSTTTTSEAGTTATFTLVLTSAPTSDVTIPLSSSRPTEGTVSPASAVFTAANWNVPQTVTVTGVDDLVADGPQTYVIAIGPATSLDTTYGGMDPPDLTFTNLDNDAAGITVGTPSTTATSENGTTATFTLVLNSQPTANVTIPASSTDLTEGTVSPGSVIFTSANWNVPQTVTVTGVDDLIADGTQTYQVVMGPASSADTAYNARTLSPLTFTNTDNDTAAIIVGTPSSTVTSEAGTTATFTLVLTAQPTADVTIPLSSNRPTEGVVSPGSVVFTAANWNVPQTVTVTGVDDAIVDGTQPYVIAIGPATSADLAYNGLDPADLPFTNLDNDLAGIGVGTPSSTFTSEAGTTATFSLVLTAQPTADVTIPLSSSDTSEGTVSPASVVFTAANWNVPQTVTVTGVDDAIVDGTQPYLIAIGPATSADLAFSGLHPADLAFTNLDNDVAGIGVGTPSTTVTSEAGTTATFTLVLTSQPTADVTIPLSSSDTTEGVVSTSGVTFTAANWNVPQTVTVTGADDFVADGTQTYQIVIGPASSVDGNYNGMDPPDLTFTNTDNDTPGVIVSPPSGLATSESGTSVTFTVVLTSQPTADVTIPLSSSNPAEGAVSPGGLIFTAADWNVPQTVTVTGIDDLLIDGDQQYSAVIGASTSLDPNYQAIDPADVVLINVDDETPGRLVAIPSSGLVTTEAGGTATFDLMLSSAPTATVGVALSSSDTTEGTVAPTTVTFTTTDWNVPQVVTVTGVPDGVVDPDVPYSVQLSTTSADPIYDLLAGTVSVTNLNVDVAPIAAVP